MTGNTLEIWIDRGGTFTDCLALHPDGRRERLKLLSHDPAHPEDSASRGIRLLAKGHEGPLLIRMGTTVATNALLERKGAPTLLLVTRGFRDALAIGHQARPEIFARHIRKPAPLATRIAEVDERVAADGSMLRPPDLEGARAALMKARADGIASVAICLMHGFRFPSHEEALARLARECGFTQVSASHMVSPLIRFVPRGDTTVADAYLSPVLRAYVEQVAHELPRGSRLLFMQSNGGLAEAASFRGKDAVLSGPAGGVVGMVAAGREAGFEGLIGFDMGGTSTDVSHWSGQLERNFETEIAGVRLRAPMLDIHTVAAGGGSICRLEAGRLVVGPQSAGAVPGPACYRLGGPLTITDCNLALGRIAPEAFPALFGPGADQPLDPQASLKALEALTREVEAATGQSLTPLALAEGLVAIANAHMADAIRRISIARGHDPATHALVAFGGAGGQHACALAEALGIAAALIPVDAGLLSACGIGAAEVVAARERTVSLPFGPDLDRLAREAAGQLVAEAEAALHAQRLPFVSTTSRCLAHIRYQGADTALPVPFAAMETMRRAFEAAHQARFGFLTPDAPLLLDMLEAEAAGEPPG
ncbi:hydantoinase/oxoprolinase family protein, partial [Thermaurantiacus sp.]